MTTTVLLWGDRWWIEGRTTPVAFGALPRAAETLLAEFGDARPDRVRLIYQPASLAATGVACPNGNRATLRAALSDEFPTLADDSLAWGFEPITSGFGQFSTVLYRETVPGLHLLVATLRTAGIEVEGAWPLLTLLNRVPEDWPESGALTVLALAADQAVVYRHTPEGSREAHSAMGAETEALAGPTIADALAHGTVALYVATLDEAGERFAARFAPADAPLRLVSWSRLASVARSLSVRQPTQLLPSPGLFHPNRLIAAASVAVLLATIVLGAVTAHEASRRRTALNEQDQERRTLLTEITRLQTNERDITQLRADLAALAPARAECAELLRALTHNRPPQVALTRLHADKEGFVISGGVAAPGLTDAAWHGWLNDSLAAKSRWTLAAPPPTPTAAFALKGRWP